MTAPPVAIGGVGGSGTRLIAAIVREIGFSIGKDLNEANDNLAFTLLFKWRGVLDVSEDHVRDLWDIFADLSAVTGASGHLRMGERHAYLKWLASTDRIQHPRPWLEQRAANVAHQLGRHRTPPTAWAWKEPNTHVVVDRLLRLDPRLRYVHVMRNGLDMAFSGNQNQLVLWGPRFLGREVERTPADSLSYWCAAHRRTERVADDFPGRVMFLNYDAFCTDPMTHLPRLLRYVGVDPSASLVARLSRLVRAPSSIGRHRQADTSTFRKDDLSYVSRLGFEVEA
jgi:hypothetical protein